MAFGSIGERLALLIDADATGAISAIKKVGDESQQQFSKAQTSQEKWSKGLMVGGAAAIGVAAVVGKGLLSTVHAYESYESAELKLQNTMSHMPQLAGASSKAFQDLANHISNTTEVDRDGVIAGEAMLGTFGLTQKQILTLTPLVVDFSQKFGVALPTAFRLVGKTAETGTNGLLRQGIVMDKTKLAADAYGTTVAALSAKVGGFATQQGKTFEGRLDIIRNQLHDLAAGVGKGATEELGNMLGSVTGLATGFGHLSEGTQSEIGKLGVVATVAVGAAGAVTFLGGAALKAKAALTVAEGEGVLGSSLSGLGVVAVGAGVALGALGLVTDLFKKKQSDAGKATNDLIGQMLAEGKTAEQVASTQLVNYIKDHGEIELTASSLGLTMRDLADAIAGNGKAYDKVKGNAKAYYDAQLKGEDILVKTQHLHGDAVSKLNADDEQRRKEIAHLTDFVDKYRKSIGDQVQKEQLAKQVAHDLASGTSDEAQATQQAKAASEQMTAAVNKQHDAEQALIDKTIDLANAHRTLRGDLRNIVSANLDVQDAEAKLAADRKDHKTTTEQLTRDELDLYNKLDAVGGATDQAKTDIENLAAKSVGAANAAAAVKNNTDGYVTALQNVAKTLKPGDPLLAWLDNYITQLHNVPSTVTTHFDTTGGNAGGTHAGGVRHFASGGELMPYESGVVGDVGGAEGELVQAGSGGAHVFNPSQIRGRGAGGTIVQYSIVVHAGIGTDGGRVGAAIVDALVAHQRQRGPLPLRIAKNA